MTKITKARIEERIKFWQTRADKISKELTWTKNKWSKALSAVDLWYKELDRWEEKHG